MKKGILAILILIMTVSISVFAEDSTVFTVDSVEDNGIVTVEVNFKNNVDVIAGQFNIIYDNSKLKLIEAHKAENITETVCEINEELSEDSIRVVWFFYDEVSENGSVVNIKFELNADKFEKSDIGFEDFEVYDESGKSLTDTYMEVVGVENSRVYSGEKLIEDTTDYEAEYEKYIQSILGDDVVFIDGLEETDNRTDETLPVDKAETDDKSEAESAVFGDVNEDDWFFDSVNYAKENGLMSGVSSTEFAPEESVTRAMLVVVLHRLEGTPPPAKSSEFADVAAGEWYTEGIAWAAEQGIVNGVEDDKFAPDAKITREQIAAILHRYAKFKGYDVEVGESTNILSYADFNDISEYAISPIQWAVGSGLVKGKTETTLNPQDNATRAEIAVILHRFIEANK